MTIEQYFEAIPKERKTDFNSVLALIKSVFPNAKENMDYNMPTYSIDGHYVASLATQKNYMALYVCDIDLKDKFKNELKGYNCGKSCIRFKKLKDDSLEIFEKILLSIKNNPQTN